MSEREVRRVEVLNEVQSGRRTVVSAAAVLDVSVRQAGPLLRLYRDSGGSGLVHKGRGQPSNHRNSEDVRSYALELVRSRYRDFCPTLLVETLYEKHGIKVLTNSKKTGYKKRPRKSTVRTTSKTCLRPKRCKEWNSHRTRFHTFPPHDDDEV